MRTALVNNDDTYVTIAKDMFPTKLGSQDVLNVCLTQASLEMQMKKLTFHNCTYNFMFTLNYNIMHNVNINYPENLHE